MSSHIHSPEPAVEWEAQASVEPPVSKRQNESPVIRSLKRLRAAFWQRRAAQWLVRAMWLGLLVPTVFMAGYLWLDWEVSWQAWVVSMLFVSFLTFLWAMRPISLKRIVQKLDKRLILQAQLMTAFELSQDWDEEKYLYNPVVQRLIQETVNIAIGIRRQIWVLNQTLWLEVQVLIAVIAILSGLLVLDALIPRVPEAPAVDLPPAWQEPTAEDVIPPDPNLMPEQPEEVEADMQASDQQNIEEALQALADALRDQAASRSVAEAIDQGDLNQAAENLRRLADQLDDLSEQGRAQLGDSMQEAADEIGDTVPDMTEPLERGNQALDDNDLKGAGQALDDLAEVLERISEGPAQTADNNQPPPEPTEPQQEPPEESSEQETEGGGGEGEGEGEGTSPPTEEERLAMEGEPLELESDPELEERVLQESELDAEATDATTQDSPFAKQPLNPTTGDLGPDPLTYPWQKREVVRNYFTP